MARDFIDPLVEKTRIIKGFAGSRTSGFKLGIFVWQWEDNDGKISKFTIPNSYYVPEGIIRLLGPQYWAKTQQGSRQ